MIKEIIIVDDNVGAFAYKRNKRRSFEWDVHYPFGPEQKPNPVKSNYIEGDELLYQLALAVTEK